MLEAKTCSVCKELKARAEFSKDSRATNGLRCVCKQCVSAYQQVNQKEIARKKKIYRLANREKIIQASKVYRQANQEAVLQRTIAYISKRLKVDPLFKITRNIRRHTSRVKYKFGLKSKTAELLGCSFEFVQAYLIQTAISNYGSYSDAPNAYEIDHIRPLSSAKTAAEAISFSHYSNLQYLTPAHNREKAGKLGWQLPQKLLDFPT